MSTGWICPKCQNVYAPFMMGCTECNVVNKNTPPKIAYPIQVKMLENGFPISVNKTFVAQNKSTLLDDEGVLFDE